MNMPLVILFLLPALVNVVMIIVTRVHIKSAMLRLNVELGRSIINICAMLIIGAFWGLREILAFGALQLFVTFPTALLFPKRKYPPRDIHT
jgi:hypothetical protein